jgi:hypothetical protein
MTRIERIRTMSAEDLADIIVELNITDEYCNSDCDTGNEIDCIHEKECCIRWLEEKV